MNVAISMRVIICMSVLAVCSGTHGAEIPGYLKGHETQWVKDPRAANLAWFKDAGFGMFITFSPASQVGTAGWQKANPRWQYWHARNAKLKQADYETYLTDKFEPRLLDPPAQALLDSFTAEKFDAEAVAELAVEAGMKYITFTTQHVLGRMFMFKTTTSALNSVEGKPKRDFVAELATACRKRDLGLFLYVMPPYSSPVIRDRLHTMLSELLTQYGPVAGVWFDGIGEAYNRPSAVADIAEAYAHVRSLQPHCLISFKTGFTGSEDFLAPEWHQCDFDAAGLPTLKGNPPAHVRELWGGVLRHKPVERCSTLMHGNKWFNFKGARHKTADEVMKQLKISRELNVNLLLNTGPRGDGSIHPDDVKALREVGKRLRAQEQVVSDKTAGVPGE